MGLACQAHAKHRFSNELNLLIFNFIDGSLKWLLNVLFLL